MAAADDHGALVERADASAHVMVLRGVGVGVSGFVAGVLVLAFVTPMEYGVFAVVRGIMGIVEGTVEHALGFGLLRRQEEPTREDYATLAGGQLAILLGVFVLAWVSPHAALGFGAIPPRWSPWVLATLAAMLVAPWASGARIRLERRLSYARLAVLDVSGVWLHGGLVLGAAVVGHFTYGVFIAQIALILYRSAWLHRWSPGPGPALRLRPILAHLREAAGFSAAFTLDTLREYGTPVLIARLFGLASAGSWAFAGRVGTFLQLAFESFGRVATPAAAQLRNDPPSLRRLATNSLIGSATLTLPAAGLLFVSLPALVMFWPDWYPSVSLVQVHVLFLGLAGVAGVSLLPVAVAVRGWPVALGTGVIQTMATGSALILLWHAGGSDLALVIPPVQAIAMATFVSMLDRRLRPSLRHPRLARVGWSLGTGLAVYAGASLLGVPPLLRALVAGSAMLAWIRPLEYLAAMRSRMAGP